MNHLLRAIFLNVISAGVFINTVTACSFEPSPSFSKSVKEASNIFVFRLLSAELKREDHGTAYTEWNEGSIKPIMQIKGTPGSYKRIKFSTRQCGGLNMNVGHYFLIATNQLGDEIQLASDDQSIVDIAGDFSENMPEANTNSQILNAVKNVAFAKKPQSSPDLDRYRAANLISLIPYDAPQH